MGGRRAGGLERREVRAEVTDRGFIIPWCVTLPHRHPLLSSWASQKQNPVVLLQIVRILSEKSKVFAKSCHQGKNKW